MQEKKNIVKLESQMLQDLTLICNAAYIKIFFSPAAKLPKDKMSYTIATISFARREAETHQGEGTKPEKTLQEYFRGRKCQIALTGPNFPASKWLKTEAGGNLCPQGHPRWLGTSTELRFQLPDSWSNTVHHGAIYIKEREVKLYSISST